MRMDGSAMDSPPGELVSPAAARTPKTVGRRATVRPTLFLFTLPPDRPLDCYLPPDPVLPTHPPTCMVALPPVTRPATRYIPTPDPVSCVSLPNPVSHPQRAPNLRGLGEFRGGSVGRARWRVNRPRKRHVKQCRTTSRQRPTRCVYAPIGRGWVDCATARHGAKTQGK